mmetsp:Transcript_22283/g.39246  ORF Transcript_22283/g.39246 Transcript_22283/m.39246 type:complete len:274 (-) Transcript_22283:42-863(-)
MWWTGDTSATSGRPPSGRTRASKTGPQRSQSLTGLPRLKDSGSLPPAHRRRPRADAPLQQRALKPQRSSGARTQNSDVNTADPISVALHAEEVLQIGEWSVRRSADESIAPVFVHMETGKAQWEPPQEVLAELAGEEAEGEESREQQDEEGGMSQRSTRSHHSSRPGSASKGRVELAPLASPHFRRIVLGSKSELPLRMARDILEALREDPSIFEQVQRRFSEVPNENALEMSKEGAGGLPEELDSVAVTLRCGEISDVIATEAGMQILLRVS